MKRLSVALAIVFWYSLAKRYTTWTQLFLGLAMAVAPVGGWLAVGGRELRATDNVYSFFENTAGKSVVIKVGPDPGGASARRHVPATTAASPGRSHHAQILRCGCSIKQGTGTCCGSCGKSGAETSSKRRDPGTKPLRSARVA